MLQVRSDHSLRFRDYNISKLVQFTHYVPWITLTKTEDCYFFCMYNSVASHGGAQGPAAISLGNVNSVGSPT